ncbi:hypothetical protein CsatB_026840 [Cannabis sativa]
MPPRRSVRVGRGRGRGRGQGQGRDDGGINEPPQAPQGWEERIAALEGIIHRQDEELRQLRRQPEPPVQIRQDAENRDPPAAVVYPATEARHELLAERFRKQHPPEFEGGIDPVVAEEWISRIESILQMLRVDGNDRVKCASYMLRKDARIWWEVVEQTKDVDTMNWDDFKRVFNEKYYNSAVLAAKVDEFTGLVQGSLTVTEYAQKFDRLAKFAPDLVPTDRVRAHRFVEGLKPMVARDVEIVSRGQFSYAQVVEMALTAERSENKIWKENAARRESKKGGANSNDHKKRGQDQSGQPSQDKRYKSDNDQRFNGSSGRNIPECPKCTKRHLGECRAKACYKCGKEGHIKRNCPLWGQTGNRAEPKKDDKYVPARVFAITQAEAEARPDAVQHTNEAIQKIRARMITAQSRQKSYADLKRRDIEFEVGDHVFLRVTPRKGLSVKRFGKRGKLSPRYVGPFQILDRVGSVAYRIALPPSLSGVHNVFHVSQLRKYVSDPSHILSYETLGLQEDLSYNERPVKILDQKDRILRNKTITLVKVLWKNSVVEEATWELESDMREQYPELFE